MPQTVCSKDGKSKLSDILTSVQILRTRTQNTFTYQIISICLLFWKGKGGKDGQNGEIFNNFSLLFNREKLFICFSGTNEFNLFSAQEKMVVME